MPGPDPHRVDTNASTCRADAPTPDGFVCLRDEIDDGTIRLTLSGELDIATAPELDQALSAAQSSARFVIVDLRRLTFMDCRGLAIILAAAERCDGHHARFRVVRGPPQVHRLFTLTHLDQRVEIVQTGEEVTTTG